MKSCDSQIPVAVGTSETGTVDKKGTWGKVVGFQPFLCHVVALSPAVFSMTALGVSSVRAGHFSGPECPQRCGGS